MTVNFETLGVVVDTAGVPEGTQQLDAIAGAAKRAEGAAETVGPAYARASRLINESASTTRTSATDFGRQGVQMQAAALSARQYSQAMRLLPAQITDVVTSLASGQTPFLVAIQQGGQIKDSFGGIAPAIRALSSVLSPARLLLGAVAGAAFLVAKAYNDAQKEAFSLEKSVILSGNAAGVSAGRLREMAEAIDDVVGTRGAAAQTLGELAATGKVASENLQDFAQVAQQLRASVGAPVEETIKIFTELGRSPSEAAFKLNEKINFLTESVYDQIVAAERLGDIEGAAAIAQRAYADEAIRRAEAVEHAMPGLQASARGTASAFREMWDSFSGNFLPDTPESILKKVQDARGDRPLFGGRAQFDINLFARDQFEQKLSEQIDAGRKGAEAKADAAAAIRDKERARQRIASAIQGERIVSDATISARQAGVNRELQNDLAQFAAYSSQLEAERAANLIDEDDYFSERRKLIEQNSRVQIKALTDENNVLRQRSELIKKSRDREVGNGGGGPEAAGQVAKIQAQAQGQLIQNQTLIINNESEIARLRGEAIAETNVLGDEQKGANKAVEESYISAREAAEAFLRTIERRRAREIEGLGKGSRAREIDESRSDIDDRFDDELRDLQRARRNGQIQKAAFDRELALIDEFHKKALAANDKFYEDLAAKQTSFGVGAREALHDYLDDAANVAEQSHRLFSDAFDGMEDALVDFARTGKLDFASLADSIIADIIRIQARAALAKIFEAGAQAFGSFLGGIFGSSSTPSSGAASGIVGPRADGGDVEGGRSYLVGERGPELIVPRTAGTVIPNDKLGGGMRISFGDTYISGGGLSIAQIDALVRQRQAESEDRIFQNFTRSRWAGVAA